MGTAMIVVTLAAWVEVCVWYWREHRRRNARPMTVQAAVMHVFVLGFAMVVIDPVRLLVWLLRNFVEWVVMPVRHHAGWRRQQRKARKQAARTAPPALGHRPPPPALPAGPARPVAQALPPAQPASIFDGELYVGRDGEVVHVGKSQVPTLLMRGFS